MVRIVKSGTDWKSLSCTSLHVSRDTNGKAQLHNVAVEQVSDFMRLSLDAKVVATNQRRIKTILTGIDARIARLGAAPLLHTAMPLEGRGTMIRSQESNLCNLLADIARMFYEGDLAVVNGGSVRCNKLISATTTGSGQPLTVRDQIEIFPFSNVLVLKHISTASLFTALENSFSDAHTDGRFLHFSGLSVLADWSLFEGHRVLEVWCHNHNGSPDGSRRLCRDDDISFSVAMPAFIADGYDGFTCFQDEETLIGDEGGITDTQLLLRTMGYADTTGLKLDEFMDHNEARILVTRQRIVSEWKDGLIVVAPKLEKRIAFK